MLLSLIFGPKVSIVDILESYWPVFPVAFLVSLLATPVCRFLALRLGVVDVPDATVKTHKQPTAYLGGVGILAGLLAGLLVGVGILRYHPPVMLPVVTETAPGSFHRFPSYLILTGIGFGAFIACGVGILDDILDIRPWQKLLGQTLSAAVLISVGVRPHLNQLLGYAGIELAPFAETLLAVPVVLFFILGATNSLNLLDGLDGLCAGVTSIITLAYLFLALMLATWGYSPVGDPVRLIVCMALVGGTLGFLPLNRHPASIFMGDAGSMLLGFVAGAVMLLFTETIGRWSIAAVVIFGLPILDTSVAIVRRARHHQPLFRSDRGHIYDQMMDRGKTVWQTVKTCYLLGLVYAVLGLVIAYLRFRYGVIAFVVLVVVSGWVVTRRGFLGRGR